MSISFIDLSPMPLQCVVCDAHFVVSRHEPDFGIARYEEMAVPDNYRGDWGGSPVCTWCYKASEELRKTMPNDLIPFRQIKLRSFEIQWRTYRELTAHCYSDATTPGFFIPPEMPKCPDPGQKKILNREREQRLCIPGDRTEMYLLRFDDTDRRDMIFEDEEEARAAWEQYHKSWNCWLFEPMKELRICTKHKIPLQRMSTLIGDTDGWRCRMCVAEAVDAKRAIERENNQ